MKSFKEYIAEVEEPQPEGEKRFKRKHVVKKTADANKNDDKLFNASNITQTTIKEPHGHSPSPKDAAVYESSDYSRRRKREREIMDGMRPARKKKPAQTSDYALRRKKEKLKEHISDDAALKEIATRALVLASSGRELNEHIIADILTALDYLGDDNEV